MLAIHAAAVQRGAETKRMSEGRSAQPHFYLCDLSLRLPGKRAAVLFQ